MKVFITGNKGYIGRNLTLYLKDRYEVDGCDVVDGKDVCDLNEESLKDVDVVVHLAATTSVWNEDYESLIHNNINGFVHIFNLCRTLNIKMIYTSSSCSVNVTSLYGLSKHFDDEYFNLYKWNKCIGLRLHNVYGLDGREDTLYGKCVREKKITLYNNGENRRHFTHIDKVLQCIEKCFTLQESSIFNVVNPIEMSCLEFVKMINKDIEIQLVSEKREKDKEVQYIDESLPNLYCKE